MGVCSWCFAGGALSSLSSFACSLAGLLACSLACLLTSHLLDCLLRSVASCFVARPGHCCCLYAESDETVKSNGLTLYVESNESVRSNGLCLRSAGAYAQCYSLKHRGIQLHEPAWSSLMQLTHRPGSVRIGRLGCGRQFQGSWMWIQDRAHQIQFSLFGVSAARDAEAPHCCFLGCPGAQLRVINSTSAGHPVFLDSSVYRSERLNAWSGLPLRGIRNCQSSPEDYT